MEIKNAIVMTLYSGPKGLEGLYNGSSNILKLKNFALSRQAFWAHLNELVCEGRIGMVKLGDDKFQYHLNPKQRMEKNIDKISYFISEVERFVENSCGLDLEEYWINSIRTIRDWRDTLEFRALYVKSEEETLKRTTKKISILEDILNSMIDKKTLVVRK